MALHFPLDLSYYLLIRIYDSKHFCYHSVLYIVFLTDCVKSMSTSKCIFLNVNT